MAFKPIRPKKYFDDSIAKEIINWKWQWYYKPIFDILKPDFVVNAQSPLIEALTNGSVYYQNGAFYGKFNNKISLELEKIGAKWSKYGKCYRLVENKIPNEILSAIAMNKAKTTSTVLLVKKVMDGFLGSLDEVIKQLSIKDVVTSMFDDLQNRLKLSLKAQKIPLIEPTFSDNTVNFLTKNYTENLEYYIKKWQPEDIIKMREVVGQMAIEGKSRKTIAQYIESRFKVDQEKAKFLARNESSIATTEYLKSKYQEMGYTHFKWITNYDGRERELHKELGKQVGNKYGINGTNIFRFDNPPVIYEHKGEIQRGLPGETYNCRCTFIPVTVKE